MFWRFGFHNASTIDSLLDKEDVALEAILDEDDLLQECKAQNTRLIDYFGRVSVLHKLFGFATGQIEGEEKGRFKYPYVATEVLCSDIWSIVETCIREKQELLTPFWETVLDRSPEDMKTQMILASHFAKINAVFLNKKPAEMLAFIQSQPSIVERLLRHVEAPSIVDLIVQIIQLDDQPGGGEVLEWLSSQDFIGRLLDMLAPNCSSDVHTVVADLLKGIISMATPSPAASLTDSANGPASNLFARELALRSSVEKLVSYIVHDFGTSSSNSTVTPQESANEEMGSSTQLPTMESSLSSVVNSISIIIELIRKNNSDYFEPYLFHTLRNRLIQLQQQLHGPPEESREILENAMREMVNRMGVVHLGPVLEVIGEKMTDLRRFLHSPRSLAGNIQTTVGSVTPLTFERFRICELFAELLHCSNMALLNRPLIYNHLYDSKGRLQGGLSALEELAQVIASNGTSDSEQAHTDGSSDIEPAMELPISGPHSSPSINSEDISDSSGPGSSDEEAMEEIAMLDDPDPLPPLSPSTSPHSEPATQSAEPSSPISTASLPSTDAEENSLTPQPSRSAMSPRSPESPNSKRSSRKNVMQELMESTGTPGSILKQYFLEFDILSTLLDLFFEFRWNNFLHSTVYDVVHQVLTGNVESGLNRELVISLFRDAKLMHRIVEGQHLNDVESSKPKGVRIGYMGHLTLLAEDVIIALERYPTDLHQIVMQYAPDAEWNQYVTGRFQETKEKDSHLLGGGKPIVGINGARGLSRWRVDEDDTDVPEDVGIGDGGTRGEFRRTIGDTSLGIRNTADFGSAQLSSGEDDQDDEEAYGNSRTTHFARYLAQEIQSSTHMGESSDSDDDDEGGWLSHSNFSLGSPPVSARRHSTERRPLDSSGFDDAFGTPSTNAAPREDPFSSHEDDGFGPFSDNAAAHTPDSTIISSFSDEMDDSSFESFGDFGEFQSADGDADFGHNMASADQKSEGGTDSSTLTPITGSWTFANVPDELEEFKERDSTRKDGGQGKGKERER